MNSLVISSSLGFCPKCLSTIAFISFIALQALVFGLLLTLSHFQSAAVLLPLGTAVGSVALVDGMGYMEGKITLGTISSSPLAPESLLPLL
jgi:hypothetical protein